VQGQDKVYKDVIEPLESVSINMIPTTKEDIRDLGPPDQVYSIVFYFLTINQIEPARFDRKPARLTW
jgi:hypothetical protein